MALTTTTPLMSLVLPVPGPLGQLGPTWATDLVTALTKIDSHNHSSGSGAKITPAALNINQDLSVSQYSVTDLGSAKFTSLAATLTANNCLSVVGGDLYFNNATGTAIRITAASSVNVSGTTGIGGDYASSSASVVYSNSSKAYVFNQGTPNTSVVANITTGQLAITEPVSGGQAVTVKVPTGLSVAYTLTLPSSLQGSGTELLNVSPTGQIGRVSDQFLMPTGVLMPFGGTVAPTGWLLADGSAVSRATYAALFAVIGTSYGAGDGSATFNLPDTRGVFLRGAGAQTRYTFTITSASATAGAVYSNNGQTFTVLNTISSGTSLLVTGTGAPTASGTLTKVSGTGAATITFSASTSKAYSATNGVAQADTTAKNGLANASSAVSGTVGGSDGTHTHTWTTQLYSISGGSNSGIANTNNGFGQGNPVVTTTTTGSGHGHGFNLTAAAQTITGDTETRPASVGVTYIIKT